METCERTKRFKGHQAFVNTVSCARRGPQILCSGSDDGTVKVRSIHLYIDAINKTLIDFTSQILKNYLLYI